MLEPEDVYMYSFVFMLITNDQMDVAIKEKGNYRLRSSVDHAMTSIHIEHGQTHSIQPCTSFHSLHVERMNGGISRLVYEIGALMMGQVLSVFCQVISHLRVISS